MDKEKLVSVIIPVYNSENFIERCIDSVLKQTYKNIEVILINDGSEDNSGKICESYLKKDERVRVEHQSNLGVSTARNQGIKISRGHYIQFVDSDDYIDKDMIKNLINEFDRDTDLVMCGYRSLNIDTSTNVNKIISKTFKKKHLEKKEFLNSFYKYLESMYINYIWNKLYLAEIIREHQISFNPTMSLGEDLVFNLDYLEYCQKIILIEDVLYNYVKNNSESITSVFNKNMYTDKELMYSTIRHFLIQNDAYNENNKITVEKRYIRSTVASINQFFHRDANYTNKDLRKLINRVVMNNQINKSILYFNESSFQNKLIGRLIKGKKVSVLIYYFKIVNWMQNNMTLVYEMLYKFNKKSHK